MPIQFRQDNIHEFKGRFTFFAIATVFFFLVVMGRLYYLQILKGGYYRLFSNENTLKEIKVPAIRGIIYDRRHEPLVTSRSSFDITMIPQYVKNFDQMKKALNFFANVDPDFLDKKWKESKDLPPFFPITVARDVDYEKIAQIRVYQALGFQDSDGYDLRGIEIASNPLRDYPSEDLFSSTLGYVREISANELSRYQTENPGQYRLGDLVGASGIEKQWDSFLKGKDGYVQIVVDAVGREITSKDVIEFLRREPARHGNNLILTLDKRLQKFAEDQFKDRFGGMVVLNIFTGEILTFVSRPQYNPSLLVGNVSPDIWKQLSEDPNKPFLNRAYQSSYPPGSTYKIVTALAALEEGVITPTDKIYCPGHFKFGSGLFKCWKSAGHGSMDIYQAIVQSCDVFFYNMGVRLGVDRLAKHARSLGLGIKTGLRLPGEQSGLIPTEAWKERVYKRSWNPGETVSVAIGQGYDLVTPLQNAVMIANIVNETHSVSPHFVKSFEDEKGEIFQSPPLEDQRDPNAEIVFHQKKNLDLIRNALGDVVNSPWGTARGSRLLDIAFGGKTGTAQVISEKGRTLARMRGAKGNFEDHAWFVAFATLDHPELAVSVLVEHGGHGSSAAAPIASDVIAEYYRLKALEGPMTDSGVLDEDYVADSSIEGERNDMEEVNDTYWIHHERALDILFPAVE